MSLMGPLLGVEFTILNNAFCPGNVSKLVSVHMQSSGLFFDRAKCLFKYRMYVMNVLYRSPQCHFNPCSCRVPSCPP